jgi:hypothetical protein
MCNASLEDDTMKTIINKLAIIALLSAAATGSALAESGSDRMLERRQQNLAADSGQYLNDPVERFAQVLEQQPPAAGQATVEKPLPGQQRKSPALRDRELYGSNK